MTSKYDDLKVAKITKEVHDDTCPCDKCGNIERDHALRQGALSNVKVQREKVLVLIGTITRQLIKYPTSPNLNKDLKMLTTQLSHLEKVLTTFGKRKVGGKFL